MEKKREVPKYLGYSRTTPYGKKYIGDYKLTSQNHSYKHTPRREDTLPFLSPHGRSLVTGEPPTSGDTKRKDSKLPKYREYSGTFSLPKHKDYTGNKTPAQLHEYEHAHEYADGDDYGLNYMNFYGFSHSIDQAKRSGAPKSRPASRAAAPKPVKRQKSVRIITPPRDAGRPAESPLPSVSSYVSGHSERSERHVPIGVAAAAAAAAGPSTSNPQPAPLNYSNNIGALGDPNDLYYPYKGYINPLWSYKPRTKRIVYHHLGPPPPHIRALYFPERNCQLLPDMSSTTKHYRI